MTIIGRVAQPSCIAGLAPRGPPLRYQIGAISVIFVTAVYATAYGRDQRITLPRLVRAADSHPRLGKIEIHFAGILYHTSYSSLTIVQLQIYYPFSIHYLQG